MGVVWGSQGLSIMGFSFAFPFVPFFLHEDLGVTGQEALAVWVALFSFAAAASMGAAAPLWGWLADRYGRRVMLIRANLAGAACMSLMGFAGSPGILIALRVLQGALTGTTTAAQAYLAGEVPEERRGLAVGGLAAAVFAGSMAGSFLGGVTAERLGYRAAFWVSGALLAVAGAMILGATKETGFRRAEAKPAAAGGGRGRAGRWPESVWWALGLIAVVSFVRQQDMPYLGLLVQDILGTVEGASLWTGGLNAAGCVAGLGAGLLAGWLADRVKPGKILLGGALAAMGFSAAQGLAQGFGYLFPVRFLTVFAAGFLEPTLNAILAKKTPGEMQGRVFGWASSTRSFGWALGPLLAGAVAAHHLRGVFFSAGVGYAVLAGLTGWMLCREGNLTRRRREKSERR